MYLAMGRSKFGTVVYGIGTDYNSAKQQVEALCISVLVYHYVEATTLTIDGNIINHNATSVVEVRS